MYRVTHVVVLLAQLGFTSSTFADRPAVDPTRVGRLHFNTGVVDTSQLDNLKSLRTGVFADSRTYVIQLDGPMTPLRQQALRNAGVITGEYLPHYAYVTQLKGVARDAVASLDFVRWIGEFRREWKLDPELGRRNFATPERQAILARGDASVMITLFENRPAGNLITLLGSINGVTVHYIEDEGGVMVVHATLRATDLTKLAELDDVHYVEEAPEITLRNSTTRWIVQTNTTNVTSVWDKGITGTGQVVHVMDGRVNQSHCSFRDTVNPIGPLHRKILAYNTTAGYDQHGTHVAGTAIGQDINGATDNTRGMAYNGKLVYSPITSGETGFYNATTTAHNQGARVHTNSWGNDGTTNYDGLCRGIDRFSYDQEDSLVLFAVTNTATLKNPENAKNVLAVGASGDTPNQANFCSGGQGPTVDGRRKPEIYAPGCSTTSSSGSGSVCTTASLTGTSMASPAVAGCGLLVRQYYTDGYYPTGAAVPGNGFTPSGALIKATLLNSTVDMTGIAGYPSAREGWGRVLLENALYFAGDARKLVVPADVRNASGMSTGQQAEYPITVNTNSQPLKVTLVFTDPAASASTGSGSAEINNLDLEVIDPSSNLYRGNVFSGGVSVTGGTADPENNVEMVLINAPPAGLWTLRVKATAVNVGTQGYALVASGDVSDIAPAPVVASIVPSSGDSGDVVAVTSLSGSNFQTSGTTVVKLKLTGEPDIVATGVTVVNSTQITCTVDLTAAEPGAYDVEVTNPDTQSDTLPAAFTINLNCLKADVDRNGVINGADIRRFTQIVVNGGALPVERCAGDVDDLQDGVVDEADVPNFVDCILNEGCGRSIADSRIRALRD